MDLLCFFFLVFAMPLCVCLFVPCGHLLGKGGPLGSRLWCITVSLLLSYWYPGPSVVLDLSIPDLCTLTYFAQTQTQQPHRRIPFHVRKDVEKELSIMKANGLIEEVDRPTLWVPPIVVALKSKSPNEVRICVDMREPNRAIKRTRYIIPTVVDIIVDLNGA